MLCGPASKSDANKPRSRPEAPAIVLQIVPHGATRVVGSEPRLMAYFRVTSKARPERNRAIHPQALCDVWQDWPGMAEVLAEERGTTVG